MNLKLIQHEKIGHIHFTFKGEKNALRKCFEDLKPQLLKATRGIQRKGYHSRVLPKPNFYKT